MATIIIFECKICSKKFKKKKGYNIRNKNFFCSRKCFYKSREGSNNNNWNGGKRNRNGYVQLRRPNHPFADNSGYVMEHRLVMEEAIGRYLDPSELVHHKDENPLNNVFSNLAIKTRKKHPLCHPRKRNKKGQFT